MKNSICLTENTVATLNNNLNDTLARLRKLQYKFLDITQTKIIDTAKYLLN